MTHFAKITNGIVQQVIVAEPEFFAAFVDTSPGEWLQTSYNTRGGIHYEPNTNTPSKDQSKALRKNFAGIGFSYDKTRDAFIPPKPFNSWILDESSCLWNPPMPRPEGDGPYWWDENAMAWILQES